MKVLVAGDAMSDLYWHGEISRISPEAPVPVVAIKKVEKREGAAANVANNIEAMGVQVERLYGYSSERIEKIRLMGHGQHIARVDFDRPQHPIQCDVSFAESVARCEIVVFSDYGKGSLSNIQALIGIARSINRTVLIDPKGFDYAKYRGATLIKPNRDEMRELVGGWSNQDELDFKARQFLVASGIDAILLTQGIDGMTLYNRAETIHLESENKTPVDVSGAGEAVLSAYAAALAKGMRPNECLRYANKAAGIAVSKFGTVVVKAEELWN